MNEIFIIIGAFFCLRLTTLFFSIRNEKRIKGRGAVEYGHGNSALLTLAHIAYYAAAIYECYASAAMFDNVSMVGVGVMAFAYVVLFYVIYKLRDIWTVKLYILKNQRIDRSFLFRNVRHPNYFLNIIPELIGTALLCHAWYTLCIGLPIYLIPLFVRIRQEEQAMKGMI